MAIKLKIKGFQSIENSEVVIDGFTVITGPNNEGKSALVRSIKGLFSNYSGSKHGWVRHGHKSLSVDMEFEDGNRVLWERGPKTSRYEINGDCLEKTGQYVPEELEAVGVHPLTFGSNTKVWPQIADQFNQTFLVMESGSIFAEAIADVDRVGKLNKALRKAEQDRRGLASKAKVRRSDLKDIEVKLHNLKPLNKAERKFKLAEKCREACVKTKSDVSELYDILNRIGTSKYYVQKLRDVDHLCIPEDEEFHILQKNLKLSDYLTVVYGRVNKYNAQIRETTGVNNICLPVLDTLSNISSDISKLTDLNNSIESKRERLLSLDKEIPVMFDESEFDKCNKITQVASQLKSLKTNIDIANENLIKLDSSVLDLEKDHEQIEASISEILGEMEICPTCGVKYGKGHEH